MKKILFILFILSLFLLGCAKDITQSEAAGIATQHIISEYGITTEALEIHEITLRNDGWYVKVLIGDDKGTVIIDKKGNVLDLKSYEWI
jgi:hypothetical protein